MTRLEATLALLAIPDEPTCRRGHRITYPSAPKMARRTLRRAILTNLAERLEEHGHVPAVVQGEQDS